VLMFSNSQKAYKLNGGWGSIHPNRSEVLIQLLQLNQLLTDTCVQSWRLLMNILVWTSRT
jgi:hypothetical protein